MVNQLGTQQTFDGAWKNINFFLDNNTPENFQRAVNAIILKEGYWDWDTSKANYGQFRTDVLDTIRND